jgi:lysozyme
MQPSQNLVTFIAEEEGLSRHAYLDPPKNTRKLYSTGYGHQIQPNERYLLTKILTQAEAKAMLVNDLKYYVHETNLAFKRPPSQGLFDAAVDIAYNAGVGVMQRVVSTWNVTGSLPDTAAHFIQYDKVTISPGIHKVDKNLAARREKEIGWFSSTLAVAEKKNIT